MLNDYGKSLFKPWCSVQNVVLACSLLFVFWLGIRVYSLNSSEVASWVQAFGSIGAIIAAAKIASADRRFALRNIREKDAVVVSAVRERCIAALGAIRSLNYQMRTHYRPITSSSPLEVKRSLHDVEDAIRDLSAIDLIMMPNTNVVECVIVAKSIVQFCRDKALVGWDASLAVEVREYSPLESLIEHMEEQIKLLAPNF